MWLRKLQRIGGSTMLTVPQPVARIWERRQTTHVEILFEQPDRLVVRPLVIVGPPVEQLVPAAVPPDEPDHPQP